MANENSSSSKPPRGGIRTTGESLPTGGADGATAWARGAVAHLTAPGPGSLGPAALRRLATAPEFVASDPARREALRAELHAAAERLDATGSP